MSKLLSIATLVMSATATAASFTDLGVSGQVLPPACNITTGTSQFNIGAIAAGTLSRTGETRLTKQNTELSIVCAGPTLAAIVATDNRAGTPSAAKDIHFGMGLDSAGNKIGWYEFEIPAGTVTLDGVSGFTVISTNNGASWTTPYPGYIGPTAGYITTFGKVSSSVPGLFTSMTSTMRLAPTIANAKTLDTRTEIQIDGLATLELNYL